MRGMAIGIGLLLLILGIGSIATSGKPGNDVPYATALGIGLGVLGVMLMWGGLGGGKKK